MITAQQIRQDLMEIRYYYAHREELDKAADIIGENATVKKIMRYNQAVADAPPRLYHILLPVCNEQLSVGARLRVGHERGLYQTAELQASPTPFAQLT